ncbi:hypothetical protein TWF225_004251 [Orbilia oligospora]|uniref:tyrosinase n=1 Tax=Orbilia oligospora TaxID=2813651 RepID=A0A7C8K022_ORBOL|nr:hypothetical protein TWF751_002057 [Orbilia oligospora]KAF3187546.1 hypothetical protein TWF225_004251 [Orbilia oligospora]KAF3245125.1 hypothetical protein TWF128_009519 [Orbilia oligospora]KAF3272845.1 hypothetical protein TWF217_000305 [Orbilia oligospora]KAF3277862.1 hypothetical protein TWF132_001328 [Orbilia oligospora]
MTRTSFLVQTVISALCLNGAVYAMDSEADWVFAANNLAKRAIAVPSPTQKGQPTNCIAWKNVEAAEADSGDCDLIVSKYKSIKLTEAIFLSLNPALKGDCANLQKNFYVCVQVGASTGAAKTAAAAGSKTTAVKAATTPKTPAKAEEEEGEEEEEEDDRHADNPPAVKLTTKNPAPPTKLEAEEKDQFLITGAGDTTLSPRFCAPRRNLVNLQKELPDTFNLLVLALDKMMKTPDSDARSYFQISGIHGAPFISWPVPGESGIVGLGYCSHNSVIFSTWHRPYILAFEQTLYRHGRDIVRRLFTKPEVQKKYITALQQLRWPYWDWADSTNQSRMPKVTMDKTISVMAPDGKGGERKATIANPFYSYVFKGPENTVFKKDFTGLKATARRPEDSASSVSFDAAADNAMQSGYNTRRKQTYNALTSATTFNFFSNALEKLHNDVHMQVGGNGIMGLISYAAFDPIFWLHHNNIDRLLAIWQAANPGKYLTPDTATPSFKRRVQEGDQDDLDTPLYPWKHTDGTWWTSNDVKDVTNIWKYGYGYPEVPCYYQGDTNTLDDHATEAINRAYGDIGVPRIKGRAAVKSASVAGRNVTEWDINIIVDQAELPGTFSIYVFLGNPPADPKKWDMSSQKVSTMTLLGNPGVAKMSKLEGMTIPLGPLLAQKGVKGTEKEIQDYLAKYLVWTCMSLGEEGGTKPYDVKLMKSLKVVVTSRNVFIPSDMKVKPKASKAKIQTAATKNQAKSGGASTLAELANTKLKGGATAHLRIGILPDIQNTTVTGKSYS